MHFSLFQQPQEYQDLYIFLLHQSMTKRICLNKLHKTLLIDKSILNWNLEKKKKNEYMISWEWGFLEVSSICEEEGREFVSG